MKNQFYKYNAYRKAAQSILDYPNKISSIDDVKDLVKSFLNKNYLMKALKNKVFKGRNWQKDF